MLETIANHREFTCIMTTKSELVRKTLGNSDMRITAVGLGAWAIGGDWQFGWGHQEDDDSIAAIRRALELGINWIDTAAAYGLGHSEEVVARALEGLSHNDRPYIFTKCGLVRNDKGEIVEHISPASIRREAEASLRRLKIERIDLYQIHWSTDEIADIDGAWETMTALQREGKIRYAGVSNFNVAEIKRAQKIGPVTSLQPPYSLIRREVENEILPYCKEENIGVIVYSPMGSGLLSGTMTRERIATLPAADWRRRSDQFKEPKISKNLRLVEKLRKIADRDGRGVGEVAIAWTLANPAVTAAIVGARSPKQVDGWIGAAAYRLSAQDVAALA
jgi:aryl-alcohol dehydrogenase-like predicted oxidoreductase